MSPLNRLADRPGALIAVSVVLALVVGFLTSSLFGVGLFLVLPSVVAWLARR
jgi:type IV secretory pathway TrbD component